jgi:hypothetical protein
VSSAKIPSPFFAACHPAVFSSRAFGHRTLPPAALSRSAAIPSPSRDFHARRGAGSGARSPRVPGSARPI